MAFGIRQSMGLYMRPISEGLGWGREVLSIALATQNLLIGIAAPFFGALADKWGPPKTLALGGIFFALGLLTMSQATTPFMMFTGAGLITGIGLGACGMPLVLATVSQVAPEEKRSLWVGVITTFGTGGQLLVVPTSQSMISNVDWTSGIILLTLMASIIIPIALAMSKAITPETGKDTSLNIREALAEAFHHRGYKLLTAGFFVCGFHVAFMAIHLPAYVNDRYDVADLGATALMLIAFFNMIGAWTSGWLGGRYSKKYLLTGIYSARALVMTGFLVLPTTPITVVIFSALIGLLWLSTVPVTSGLVSQIFGLRYMGMLFGIVFLSHQVGAFAGVWLGGRVYDATGSYDAVWWMAIALAVASALIHLPINDQPVARLSRTTA
ncbi:MAG TPA: MFS transporter [Rhodospirillaceae bacterium]|nr:MFS transporter [Rhodospirillaceae bacterium]HAT36561.1 MFS transporter [Rhodospirillaceae bacterium]